ncbi:hypothetical protein [Pseudopontixanthobacter vadosimaris]|uniref:hypothetical protein n=1 Tax=Pseudopontixanthobacter vadosimaris TaxID=2726450 RepID=UPI00147371C6|nr:hypothetical protein [Pseudopontixanthobacter vadosimaris]
MNAMTHSFARSDALAATGPASGPTLSPAPAPLPVRWAALQDAGAAVAGLAGQGPAEVDTRIRDFPARLRDAAEWQQGLAEQGIDDLSAIMRSGLTALLAVSARGQDPSAAAHRLWAEFTAACDAILMLVPGSGKAGPKRTA